jgi:hypothetical protein
LIQNILLSFTGLTKVLVTTGYGEGSNSKRMEIIDLEDPTNVCQPSFLGEYPIDVVRGASAGLLANNNALICGGIDWTSSWEFQFLDNCFAINENELTSTAKLLHSRSYAASVVLKDTTLWLTGGYLDGFVTTKSTELVELTGTTPGSDLPFAVSGHCLVSLNETTVLLIGGFLADNTVSKATLFYNSDHQTWTEGPSLITGRAYHSCALFKDPQQGHIDTVIVTGGGMNYEASTKFFYLDTNSWTSGKGHYLIYIIIWLSLLLLLVRIPFTAKPAGLDPPNFCRHAPTWLRKINSQKKLKKIHGKF